MSPAHATPESSLVVKSGGVVAENIGPLALYSESTVNTAQYENRALLKRRYENQAPLGHAFGAAGACSGFQTNEHAHTVCVRVCACRVYTPHVASSCTGRVV